jgi:crotonobetainyl-CoA:carnitine CoA-transferase CaiB-like acyl-CoA transferase
MTGGRVAQPLEGLRVVEVGGTVTAAAATKRFSDFGGAVIQVDPPGGGEVRRVPPFPEDRPHIDRGAFHLAFNTGKRSLVLDHRTPSGREVLGRLATVCELMILDLPPEEARAVLARVDPEDGPCTVVITPHGMDGPYEGRVENDLSLFAWSTRAHRHSIQGREPLRYAPFLAMSQVGSTAAAVGIASIWGRRQDGRRRDAEIAAVEAITGNVDTSFFLWAVNGAVQPRAGGQSHALYPAGAWPCADGHMMFSAGREPFFSRVCEAIGKPELARDPRFADPRQKPEHFEEFAVHLREWLSTRTKYEVFEHMQRYQGMAVPLLDASEVMADPQMVARHSYVEVEQPGVGAVTIAGAPFHMDGVGSDAWQARPAPTLDEHGPEILAELGYTPDEQIALFRAGVTG